MNKIWTVNKISKTGTALLAEKGYQFCDEGDDAIAAIVRSAKLHDTEFPNSLLAIARAGAGYNNIPTDRCAKEGIVVFNTPGANANAVKEMVILALLMGGRKIAPSLKFIETLKGKGDEVSPLVEKGKGDYAGPEIMGKTLGVIGLGAIGVLVANAAAALGMKVYGYDPFISVQHAWGLSRRVVHAQSLKELYENCDFLTLHLPYNAETKDMINDGAIEAMKDGVRILNFARGELCKESAILKGIESKKIGYYITDFPTDDMLLNDGVIAFPHLGASTPESEENCAVMASEQIYDFLQNGNIINSVNMPNLTVEREGDKRICIINKNTAGMIAAITEKMSDSGVNIANMANKSRDDYAYTVIDIDGDITDFAIKEIESIDGVIRVRVI